MKIVVLDGYTENPGDLSWGALEALGELTVYDRTSLTDEAEIISRIGDAEAVYTNKTPITRHIIDACPNMGFIGVLATGSMSWTMSTPEKKISLSAIFLHMAQRPLANLPLPCCWKSATMWPTIPKQSIRAAGSPTRTGASGTIL